MFASSSESKRFRDDLFRIGCCREHEAILLVVQADVQFPGKVWQRGTVVISVSHLLVLQRQSLRSFLRLGHSLSCELRILLTDIESVKILDQNTLIDVQTTSVGNVEISASNGDRIANVLLEARDKILHYKPGQGDLLDSTTAGNLSNDREAGLDPPSRFRSSNSGRLSFISTGDSFDRLRRSSAIRDVFEKAAVMEAIRPSNHVALQSDAPLERIIKEPPPSDYHGRDYSQSSTETDTEAPDSPDSFKRRSTGNSKSASFFERGSDMRGRVSTQVAPGPTSLLSLPTSISVEALSAAAVKSHLQEGTRPELEGWLMKQQYTGISRFRRFHV